MQSKRAGNKTLGLRTFMRRTEEDEPSKDLRKSRHRSRRKQEQKKSHRTREELIQDGYGSGIYMV